MVITGAPHFWLNTPHLLGFASQYPGPLCFPESCMKVPGALSTQRVPARTWSGIDNKGKVLVTVCANDSENTLKGGQAAAPTVLSFVKSFLTLQSWGEKKDFPVITVFGKLLHEQRAVGVCHPNFCPAFGSHLKPWLEKSWKKQAETQILLSALTKQGAWCWPEVISCVGHWKHCRAITTNLAWQNWRTLTSWNLHPTLTAIATRQPNTVSLPWHWKVIFNLKISG